MQIFVAFFIIHNFIFLSKMHNFCSYNLLCNQISYCWSSTSHIWLIYIIQICRSYELMEDTLKVYIYREGRKPVLHQPRLTGIYASEGWFMKLLEANKNFITKDPRKAHLFYLPFSSLMLEETLYIANSHSFDNLIQYLKNYLDLIEAKYPFWNRTGGADHFLVACHDWV